MADFITLALAWIEANRGPVAAATIVALVALPFLILHLSVRSMRRSRARKLMADTREPLTFSLERDAPHREIARGEARTGAHLQTRTEPAVIAVLPFENRSRDGELGQLVEEFSQDLAQLLQNSSLIEVREVSYAREADSETGTVLPIEADYLLVGSIEVFMAGPRRAIYITVQIVEVATGDAILTEVYEGPLRALGGTMDEISDDVSGILGSQPAITPHPDSDARTSRSLAVWALQTRVETVVQSRLSRQSLDEAARLLDHAARIDPGEVSAKQDLAEVLCLRALFMTSQDVKTDLERARKVLRAASVLASAQDPEQFCAEGMGALAGGDAGRAVKDFSKALELTPDDGLLIIFRAWAQLYAGDDAIDREAVMNAVEQSPSGGRAALGRFVLGLQKMREGDFAYARETLTHAVTDYRAFHMNWLLLGLTIALDGKRDDAANAFFRARRVMGPSDEKRIRSWVDMIAPRGRSGDWLAAFDTSWRK